MKAKLSGLVLLLGAFAPFGAAQDASEPDRPVSPTELRQALSQIQDLVRAQATQLEALHQQVEHQQQEIEQLRHSTPAAAAASSGDGERTTADGAARLTSEVAGMRAAANPPAGASTRPADTKPAPATAQQARVAMPGQRPSESGDSPLSIHFGKASMTPGGWVDFTSIFRSSDVGGGLGTAFASIPYSNTVQGGLSETRFTAQGSRITLRADESFGNTRVFGYGEADFNGYLPSNAYVSTNSDSLRLRVYFADIARGRWEFLGGQSWSMLTPNRVGISPFLSEIYNTLHLDSNYQVGLTYARQTQLRAVYHFRPNAALAVSAENPEQYSGSAPTFPALFSTSQSDLNSSSSGGGTSTPTLHPDLVAKLAADAGWHDRRWHFEAAGLLTPVAILTPSSVTGLSQHKDIREGGGLSLAANLEVQKNLHLVLTGFWSDGGGRYIGGLGPGFVVSQAGSKTSPFQAQLVHSGSTIAAAEWRANRNNMLSLTWSEAYFGRSFSTDPSTGALIGYGYSGSANSNNRLLQEGTFATQTTLWRQPGYGAVQVITQSSWIRRTPWYLAPDTPKDAHVFAGYANLRYVLP